MADDEIDPDDLKEADEIFGEGGGGAGASKQEVINLLKEAKQNGLSRGDAIRKAADATDWGVQEIRPVADIVYVKGGGGGAGREVAGALESGAEGAAGAVESGVEGAAEGIGEAAGVTYKGIEGVWELLGSWLVFLVALVGPLTAMNVMGMEMNAILGLTTIMMSGGAAILYAKHTDMTVFGVDFRAQHWTWAAGAGIFFGILSAFYGGGIVVAGATVVLITIAWPLLGRSSTRYARFFQRHEGLAALVGTGITVLMATHLYLIGVPTQLITVLIGVLAVVFYAGKIENDYIGLILTLAWLYYTGRWAMTLIGGDFVNLAFAIDLLTSILISTYVVIPRNYGGRKEYTGFSHAWEALHKIPGAGDEFYEFGVAGFGIGLFFWFLAQGTGVASGGLLSLAATWFIFISILLVGPVHLKRSVNQIKAGAWDMFSDREWAPRDIEYGEADRWYNTERPGYREREEWEPRDVEPGRKGRWQDRSQIDAESHRAAEGIGDVEGTGISEFNKRYEHIVNLLSKATKMINSTSYPDDWDQARRDDIESTFQVLDTAERLWDKGKYDEAKKKLSKADRKANDVLKAINSFNPNDPRGY